MPLVDTSGEIVNASGHMGYEQATRHLFCNLENMQLKKFKRSERRNAESVTQEKFTLLFRSEFQAGDMRFNVNYLLLQIEEEMLLNFCVC